MTDSKTVDTTLLQKTFFFCFTYKYTLYAKTARGRAASCRVCCSVGAGGRVRRFPHRLSSQAPRRRRRRLRLLLKERAPKAHVYSVCENVSREGLLSQKSSEKKYQYIVNTL